MIDISEEITVEGTPGEVWEVLRDPMLVASCIPGATLTAAGEDGDYQGTVKVKFGPTVVAFRGETKVLYDDAQRRVTIEGSGVDQRGASRALASGTVTVAGVETAMLSLEGGFHIGGPLEGFARTGGIHVARALLAEFAANLATLVRDRRSPTPAVVGDVPIAAPQAAASLNANTLLWRVILGWLQRLNPFRRKGPDGQATRS